MAICVSRHLTSCSQLNPDAPLFVPSHFVAAEDFSPEWWRLVQTCPAFREYWLSERFDPDQVLQDPVDDDELDALLDAEDGLFDDLVIEELICSIAPSNKQENIPPSEGFMHNLDVKQLTRRAGISDLQMSPKQYRRMCREPPVSAQAKPPRVVSGSFQKPCGRKIHQPR